MHENNSKFADYLETLNGLLNVNQVATLLGVHRDTVYRWIKTDDLPALNIGRANNLVRFAPKDLAAWVRGAVHYFRGPWRDITDWMSEQLIRCGGPRCWPPPLTRVLELIGYDWLVEVKRWRTNPDASDRFSKLMDDFREAVQQLSLPEQRQLIEDIKSGKVNGFDFECEDAE